MLRLVVAVVVVLAVMGTTEARFRETAMSRSEEIMAAQAANAAYKDDNLCFKQKGVQVAVTAKGSTTIVAFRGTDETQDWFRNFRAHTTTCPFHGCQGKVHSGWLNGEKLAREKILEMVVKLGHKRVIVTGHSLGGALAVLFATDLLSRDSIANFVVDGTMSLVTFGQPAAGNSAFNSYAAPRMSHYKRYVNCFRSKCKLTFSSNVGTCDLVTNIPGISLFGLKHFGRKVINKIWHGTEKGCCTAFCTAKIDAHSMDIYLAKMTSSAEELQDLVFLDARGNPITPLSPEQEEEQQWSHELDAMDLDADQDLEDSGEDVDTDDEEDEDEEDEDEDENNTDENDAEDLEENQNDTDFEGDEDEVDEDDDDDDDEAVPDYSD